MKFFLDTANLEQIREAHDLGILDGVTTNPSLMAKEGITGEKNILKHYVDICEIVGKGDVSAEVISTDFKGMIKEGESLAKLHENIVVKIPMIFIRPKHPDELHISLFCRTGDFSSKSRCIIRQPFYRTIR